METPPPIPSGTAPAAPPAPAMSLFARLLNIFAVPGDVFEEIKQSSVKTGNWLLPLLLTFAVISTSAIIVTAQPAIKQRVKEEREKVFEDQVKAGKMSRQDADRAEAMIEKFFQPPLLQIMACFGALVGSVLKIFGWAFALWILGLLLLRVKVSYMKLAEVAGLASMIGILGVIVSLLLQVNFSNPAASPSLAMTMTNPDTKSPMFMVLQALNLFDIWQLGVMAAGLARLGGVPFVRAGLAVLGFWMVLMVFLVGLASVFGGMAH